MFATVFFAMAGLGFGGKAQPNFIMFQPDEMRAESLGCYG